MRVFVDVGAHYGETLDVALDPTWGFGRIYSLEPSRACQSVLTGFHDRRLRIIAHGLSNRAQSATLYGAGLLGASVYSDKVQIDSAVKRESETIDLFRASDWLEANISAGDEVFLKLNCEGSEVDVLDDLLDTGVISRVAAVYVDFDVRKIPSQAHRQASVERRLREHAVSYESPESLGVAGNDGVKQWLAHVCCPVECSTLSRLWFRLRLYRPPYVVARQLGLRFLPRPLLRRFVRRFGRQARRQ